MFSIEALEKGILKKEENILLFEETIKKERAEIAEYRQMIKDAQRKEEEREMIKNGLEIEAVKE